MKILFLILISLIIQGCDQPANEIKELNLHKHIEILASDEFEGRGPGSAGGEKTKLYLKEEFKKMGLLLAVLVQDFFVKLMQQCQQHVALQNLYHLKSYNFHRYRLCL